VILADACKTFLIAFQHAEGHLVPKFHLFWHLTVGMIVHGNARFYHTYPDERLNGIIASLASKCHPRTFADTVLRRVLYDNVCAALIA
jgi:hypothetical protein